VNCLKNVVSIPVTLNDAIWQLVLRVPTEMIKTEQNIIVNFKSWRNAKIQIINLVTIT